MGDKRCMNRVVLPQAEYRRIEVYYKSRVKQKREELRKAQILVYQQAGIRSRRLQFCWV